MFRPRTPTADPPPRRGAILIVVLALLALFAVIAISFVFYADAEATTARIHKEAQSQSNAGVPDSSDVVNGFLGGLIFDVGDTASGDLLNALRGHSLARAMYGWNSTNTTNSNLIPFNGVGTFHQATPVSGVSDRAMVANFTVINGTVVDPEWTNSRSGTQLGTMPASGQTYTPKDAPYTYPDANNLYLASISPETGEVLVPSFYRSWQFTSNGGSGTTGLEPTNPNWTNSQGRYLILRPRPQDNIFDSGDGRGAVSDFPYVPPNADGTYTGDVPNLAGGYNYNNNNYSGDNSGSANQFWARNDSIWMDIGLPPRQWNGRWVKPLVAALVLDLDGRINITAHGNVRSSGNHTSYAGYGPWEINLGTVLGNATDANNLVNTRTNSAASARDGTSSRGYAYQQVQTSQTPPASSARLPKYAQVNWDGTNGSQPQLPGNGAGAYTVVPNYTNPGFDDNATNTGNQTNHPSLYNPAEWSFTAGATAPRAYAISDLKRLDLRFGAELTFYQAMDLYSLASPPNTSLIGTTSSRTDLAHRNRLSTTTFGATLDVPGVMPGGVGSALSLAGAANISTGANLFPTSSQTTFSGTPASGAAIGPVDLNRPLPDYRGTLTNQMSADQGNVNQAVISRQAFARDIFARLLIATGGAFSGTTGGITNGNVTIYTSVQKVGTVTYQPDDVQILITAATNQQQFDALRYLAQLAANIVDYVDPDDISTAFVWNPVNPGPPSQVIVDQANFQTAQIGTSVVFGVERPRLVLNEAYSEITNDPTEKTTDTMPPQKSAHVRFWLELLNPTSSPYLGGGNTNPLGDGSVSLQQNAQGSYPFQLQIYQDPNGQVATSLQQTNNVAGTASGGTLQIQYNFNPAAGNAPSVSPNNGNYGSNLSLVPASGVAVFGPTIPATGMGGTGPQSFEFNPAPGGMATAAPWTNMIQAPATAGNGQQSTMEYLIAAPGPTTAALGDGTTYKRHVLVLQRLANPYLASSVTNPYITVDYMDYVPAFDSVNRASTDTTTARTAKMGNPPTGYDPITSRFSVGKVQPYAGYAFASPTANGNTLPSGNYSFPTSFVLAQQQQHANQPSYTFGQHNGKANADPSYTTASSLPNTNGETIMAPFEWLVHLDRPLVNQLELLHVAATKPHLLTQSFVSAPGGTVANIRRDLALAPWLGVNSTPPLPGYDTTNNRTNNQLFRALDLLRVKPWGYGIPLGGKVHGRINVNTIQDQRVLQALFDVQTGNQFSAPTISSGSWLATRTPTITAKTLADGSTTVSVPVPGATLDDLPSGGTDRPFKPFGVGEFSAGTLTQGGGLQDTILRVNTSMGSQVTTSYGGSQYLPYLWNTGQNNLYFQAEAARKILNNTTTVSNTFYVAFTVGFFEVRTNASGTPQYVTEAAGYNRYILGKEAFQTVPGDLRQQYVAVIDRNNLTVDSSFSKIGPRPFFTTLEAPVAAGVTTVYVTAGGGAQVYADGVAMPIASGTTLVIGSGVNQEAVAVSSMSYTAGIGTITLSAGTIRPHGQGDAVSNVQTLGLDLSGVASLGNPGPQTGFDVVSNPTNNNYLPVLPYWARVR